MHETYYTPEQLAQLEARREEVGEDQIAAIEREWAELSAQMKPTATPARTRRIPKCARSRSAGAISPNARSRLHRRRPRYHREPRPHVQGRGSGESLPRHLRRRPAGVRDYGADQ